MDELKNAKVGDKICISLNRLRIFMGPIVEKEILTVVRITEKQIICESEYGGQYRIRHDGKIIGEDLSRAEFATEEMLAKLEEQKKAFKRWHNAFRHMNEISVKLMHGSATVEQMEAVIAVFDGGAKEKWTK